MSATPTIGSQIDVDIHINVSAVNPPDNALGSYTGTLNWNPSVLSYSSHEGAPSGFTGVVNPANAANGEIAFNGANAQGATGDVLVLTITFDVIGAGTSPLDLEFSAMSAAGTFGELLQLLTVTDGQVVASSGSGVEHTLTMAVSPSGGGTTTPAVGPHDYNEGSVVNISASPASGYQFVNWTGDVTNANSASTAVTMDGDKTVTANFQLISSADEATSTATPSNATPTTGSQITVAIYIDVTKVAPPNDELGSFTGTLNWDETILSYADNSGIQGGFVGNVNVIGAAGGEIIFNGANSSGAAGNTNVLTLTFDVIGPGTSPLDLAYSAMAAASTFEDLLPVLNVTDGQVVASGSAVTQHSLTMAVSPAGSGTTSPAVGSHSYNENSVVDISASPELGFEFVEWTGGVASPTSASTTVTMNAAKTVTAVFQSTSASGSVTSSVTASNDSPVVGNQITVAIDIDVINMNEPNNALGSFSGSLDWNPAVLAYSDSEILGGFTGVTNPSSGNIVFNGANPTGATGKTTVLTVTFDVVGAGTSTLDLGYSAMAAAYSFENLLPFLTVNDDSVTASPTEYTLTVTTVGQGSVNLNPSGGTYTSGQNVTLTAVAASGWQFSSWSGALSGSTNPQTITMTSNKSVTANFTEIPAGGSVTSAVNASTHTPTVGQQITAAINIDMTNMASPDNALGSFTASLAWDPAVLSYVSDSGILSGFTGVINTNNAASGTMTFNGANASGATGNNQILTVTFNVVGAGTSALDLGYSAMAAAGSFNSLLPYLTVNDDSVTASLPTYTLTVNKVGQGTVALNPPGGTYSQGAQVQLTATPASGWKFDGWSGDLSGSTNPATITMNGTKTVTATFSEIPVTQYTLTVNKVGSGSVSLSPSGGVYDSGTSVQLTATPAAGYKFDGWSGDLSGTTNPASITMNSNKTVTATFSQIPANQYNLNILTNGQGSVTLNPAGGTYDAGTVVELTATPASGWQFAGWSGALSGMTNPTSITMDSNKTVTATFSQIPVEQYTLTVNTVGQGSVTLKPSGGIYDAGTEVTLTAVPESGWQFDGWSGDLSGTLATKVILMNSDKEVTATFTEIPAGQYALTVYTTGEGEVTLSPPGGSYDDGTEVTLTAVPEDGWKFAGWLGDLSGTANPESIVMNSDKKVSANFIKEIPDLQLFLPVVSKN